MKTLRTFQTESVYRFQEQIGLLVADDCGLGKTVTAIEAVKAVCSAHAQVLLLCPPSVIDQWYDALEDQWPGVQISLTDYVPYVLNEIEGWVIMSYYELYKPYMRNVVNDVLWDCIVTDEAHRFRNRKAKLFKYVERIPKARAIALTATPMEHGQHELWSTLHFLRPDIFPVYWGFLKKHFAIEEGLYTKWDVQGPKDPQAFGEMVAPYVMQHHKVDVMPELPKRIDIPIRVSMLQAQKELYDTVKAHPDIELDIQDQRLLLKNALSVLMKLQQISSDPQLLGLSAPSAKLQWLSEFRDDHPNDRIVMFTRFRRLADYLGQQAALIAGGVNEIDLFKSGKYQHAVCVIADSLQGVDGLQAAQHAVFIDGHWSATQMTQAIDRIHRMDITEPKNVYCLSSTAEDRMVYRAAEEKWTEQELLYYILRELKSGRTD